MYLSVLSGVAIVALCSAAWTTADPSTARVRAAGSGRHRPQKHVPIPHGYPVCTGIVANEGTSVVVGTTIHFEAQASDPDGGALHYDWSVAAGTLHSDGARAEWHTDGLEPGRYTIRADVTNDAGQGGRCEVEIALAHRADTADLHTLQLVTMRFGRAPVPIGDAAQLAVAPEPAHTCVSASSSGLAPAR